MIHKCHWLAFVGFSPSRQCIFLVVSFGLNSSLHQSDLVESQNLSPMAFFFDLLDVCARNSPPGMPLQKNINMDMWCRMFMTRYGFRSDKGWIEKKITIDCTYHRDITTNLVSLVHPRFGNVPMYTKSIFDGICIWKDLSVSVYSIKTAVRKDCCWQAKRLNFLDPWYFIIYVSNLNPYYSETRKNTSQLKR